MTRASLPVILILMFFSIIGCSDKDSKDTSRLTLELRHTVDGEPLIFNTELYENEAGNSYKVTGLRYYLSGIKLWNGDQLMYTSEEIFYIDGEEEITKLELEGVEEGEYSSMTYLIGIVDEENIIGNLPNEDIHDQMVWPEPMGGGYHFMKMEGYYYDENNEQFGFAIHQGTSIGRIEGELVGDFSYFEEDNNLKLNCNMNNLFDEPEVYNFEIDGAHTMGVEYLMGKIAQNGADILEFDN